MMFFFDPVYFLMLIPAFLLALWAQSKVKSTYKKYLQVPNAKGITGLQAANQLMAAQGLHLDVEGTPGELSDHYDPRSKTLRLSPGVANQASVASVAIVAHELGHAMQDKTGYMPLKLRGAIVPAVRLSPMIAYGLFFAGMMFASTTLSNLGIVVFSLTVVFALITLPVEFNASRRGLTMLESYGLLDNAEMKGAKSVLQAASLTYVAMAVQSLLTLVYLLGRRRR
ncbi:MAG: zinc metallopeptidase [Chloroflexota bacterium]|nr:zinc metallopeptidase [Chloroflexota bacterium]